MHDNQNLYSYCHDRLMEIAGLERIDFKQRFRDLVIARPNEKVKILSLASGAARIEENLFSGFSPERVSLTLVDINPQLIETARRRLEDKVETHALVQNINCIDLLENEYDIVICVSALHHVVELERLVQQISACLVAEGEFWSIGEFVGRNGTRLDEDAYQIANAFFKELPEKYRVNRNPGSEGGIDSDLPNFDCSLVCFEGIRSEDILPVLDARMKRQVSVSSDCFLWRLVNLAYQDNYSLTNPEDIEIIDRAIELEVEHFKAGGHPTTFNGVFVKTT